MATVLEKVSQLEIGLYEDAHRGGMSLSLYLNEMARKGELSENLYRPEARNSQGQPVDAFKQVLAAAGIRTKGELAQTGDAFFSTPSNRVLFPEYVSREYRDAERDLPPLFVSLDDLVTNREGISSNAYRTGVIESNELELEFGRVAEGGELPVYTVTHAEKAINVYKYGGILKMSYESVRRAALPMLNRYIAKVARAQRRRKIKQAMNVALNGDGNSNPAPNTATAGATWSFADLINLQFEAAAAGVMVDTIVGDSTELISLIALHTLTADGRPADRNTPYVENGTLPAPLGMELKLALPGSVLVGSRKVMGIDSADGLVEVYENGSDITEAERLITTQFEVIAISENLGYAKPERQAFRTKTRP